MRHSVCRLAPLSAALLLIACGDQEEIGSTSYELAAKCSVNVIGKGTKKIETDYLPHVIACENGSASYEALKAQAVSARSYTYYKLASGATGVKDSQGDQVYTCSRKPEQKHYDAVADTSGQVLVYKNKAICAFYVAGAKPSTSSCVPASSDPDPYNTEKYVTYNSGKTGNNITQSTLGWVSTSNIYNRGCMSQNGSNCLAKKGRGYKKILKFYYGADAEVHQTSGPCVTPPAPPPPPPDTGVPPAPEPDAGGPQSDTLAPDSEAVDPFEPGPGGSVDPGGSLPGVSSYDDDAEHELQGGCAVSGAPSSAPMAPILLLLACLLLRRRGRA